MVVETVATIDKCFFKYVSEKLRDATPDEIVAWYIQNFAFHNDGYLERLQREYKLPDDILKLHQKIAKMAEV